MKKILVLLLLTIVSCNQTVKPVDLYDGTEIIDGYIHKRGSSTPFTGVGILYVQEEKILEGNIVNGKKEGLWIGFYGRLLGKKSEENYRNGKKEGLSTMWSLLGLKIEEGNYKNGKQEGHWTYWYENGLKSEEGNYFLDDTSGSPHEENFGKKSGLWTAWYENGQKKSEGNYKDWKQEGLWIYWGNNGLKYAEGTYRNGRLIRLKQRKQDGGEIDYATVPTIDIEQINIDDSETPFYGVGVKYFPNGQKDLEEIYIDGKQVGLRTVWYENGQKRREENYKDGQQEGLWTEWYDNGQKTYEVNFNDGLSLGWYANGQKRYEGTEKDGNKGGLWTEWHANGKKSEEGNYLIKKAGLWTYWYDNGQKSKVEDYINFKKDGLYSEWYANGKKKVEGNYHDEEQEGLWTYWYYNGQKSKVENYENLKQEGHYSEWYPNGKKKVEGNYRDGKQVGLWTYWYDNGQKSKVEDYINFKKDGLYSEWYANGKKKVEGNYRDGKQEGLWTNWYENGQKNEEGNYKLGNQDGLWFYWFNYGEKNAEVNYKEGLEISRLENFVQEANKAYVDGDTKTLINYARGKIGRENYNGAILYCTRIIEINPKLDTAFVLRGSANRLLGNFQKAVNDYNAGIEINPSYAMAYYLRGLAKVGLKDFQASIVDFNRAIELNPKLYDAYYMRAEYKMDLRDYQGVIDDLTVFINEFPSYKAYLNRGLAKSALDKHSAAVIDYTKAFDINFILDFEFRTSFKVNENWWPTLDQMIVIGDSFKKALDKSASEKPDNNHFIGKWAMDDWSGGKEIIEFKENGKFTSTSDKVNNKRYEVIYDISYSSIIRMDILKNSKFIPYGYFLAHNYIEPDEEGKNIDKIVLYLIPNEQKYSMTPQYKRIGESPIKSSIVTDTVENIYKNCEPRFIGGCYDWNSKSILLGSIKWKLESNNCIKSNYTSQSTALKKGIATPMEIDNGNWCGVAVWIDFDRNGIFEQTENLYHAGEGEVPGENQHFVFNVTVPSTTANGTYRMRVISGWGTDGFTPSPNGYGACGIYKHGNFVDFTIHVK